MNSTMVLKNKNSNLKLGVIASYIAIFLNIAAGFFLTGPIISSVGTANYGIYSAASSLIHIFLIDFGLSTAATKYISQYRVSNDQKSINKLIKVIFISFIVLSVALASIFATIFVFLPHIYPKYTTEELTSLRVVFAIIAIYSVVSFPFSLLNGILIAYEKVLFSKFADIFAKLCFVASTLICILLHLGLYALTICFLINGLVSIILKLIFIIFRIPISLKTKISLPEIKTITKVTIGFSFWAAINTLSRTFLVSIMSSIMGSVAGPSEYLNFSVAAQIESYVAMFSTIFGTIFFPRVSQILLDDKKNKIDAFKDFENFFCKVSRIQTIILCLIISGFFVFGKGFIQLWVPDVNHDLVFICTVLLCSPSIFLYPLQMGEIAMATIGKIKFCALANLVSLLIGIGTAFCLTRLMGAVGGALAVLVSYAIRGILFVIVYKKHIQFHFCFYFKKVYLKLLPSFVLIAIFAIFVSQTIMVDSWFTFLRGIIVFACIYVICILISFKNKTFNKDVFN